MKPRKQGWLSPTERRFRNLDLRCRRMLNGRRLHGRGWHDVNGERLFGYVATMPTGDRRPIQLGRTLDEVEAALAVSANFKILEDEPEQFLCCFCESPCGADGVCDDCASQNRHVASLILDPEELEDDQ